MKYSWSTTNSGWSRKRCNLHQLQNFVCYFILIVFYGEPTEKQCNNRSNCRCNTPTLQTLGKQEKATNNNPVKKHQKAQLQPQDPNPTIFFFFMQCSLQSIWAIFYFGGIACSPVHAYFLHLHWFLIFLLLLFLFSCSSCYSLHIWDSATAIGTVTFLVNWLMLASLFAGCCLLLFDSNL